MICPCCGKKNVNKNHFACHTGSKGGKAGTGASKARTTEQARAAALKRWDGRKGGRPPKP